ncbi:TetR/AcrR family transcriptional regulator [Pseudonocardia dioxanivorans]|uniref:Regulatory protein TetR n=1 Tax=Pseudonocardia dioxanivorans (strain ATCC 55486 / DSM 44775 / JCM 13855 / CB1190) TaxID=675635 RepID=F4CY53_PSEUX|nr:TetR/AcrR family transcriptional regulator [Pseudonocardia dioxanivorans]AEA24675.1 regulatory protein TetR [Pseudonocardia dioxanivorans CB1190]
MPRAERADAVRNRERLLAAAKAALSTHEKPALEAVAREAGVGIGTLYRHFPTREALVEAVYRAELAALCAEAAALAQRHPPAQALRRWMDGYADFVATKRGMAEALRAVIATGAIGSPDTRARLADAVRELLAAGVADCTLREVPAEDVVAAMAGVVLTTPDREQAGRLLDLVWEGLRPRLTDPAS